MAESFHYVCWQRKQRRLCFAVITINLHLARINRNFEVIHARIRRGDQRFPRGGNVEFVMFEDVDGMEVYVNPDRVMWVREYPGHKTVISCGREDKFAVRLAPAQAVAALGKSIR
jgi:hypothetical protein